MNLLLTFSLFLIYATLKCIRNCLKNCLIIYSGNSDLPTMWGIKNMHFMILKIYRIKHKPICWKAKLKINRWTHVLVKTGVISFLANLHPQLYRFNIFIFCAIYWILFKWHLYHLSMLLRNNHYYYLLNVDIIKQV